MFDCSMYLSRFQCELLDLKVNVKFALIAEKGTGPRSAGQRTGIRSGAQRRGRGGGGASEGGGRPRQVEGGLGGGREVT